MNMPETVNARLRWPAKINEIPKEVFDRPDIFGDELERIFYGPEWHAVGHVAELARPGDYKTFALGERPLLVVRGADGEVRVFYNACSHRGTLLETRAFGNKAEFECPYHRWLFDNAGRLRGCPGRDDFAPGFTEASHGLTEVRSAIACGLVFVTLADDTPPLDAWLGRAAGSLEKALGSDGRLRLLGYQKVTYDSNWKAYIDNDGYHAPLLHSAFRLLGWQGGKGIQYATERGHMAIEAELAIPKDNGFLKDASLIEFRGRDTTGSVAMILNPLTIITRHLDVINVRFAIARAVNRIEVHYAYFAHADDSAEMARHRLRQSSNLLGPCGLVSMEDASIFHRVQVGNRSPGRAVFQKGVHRENAIWYEFKQNDEAGNLPRWEYYRRVMGFQRS